MENRRIISYVCFVIAAIAIVLGVLGVGGIDATLGILLGLAILVVGIVFYRRGK